MSRHNTIRASLAVAAAALAIGANSAGAMPMRDGSPVLYGPHAAQLDPGQASLAQEHSAMVAAAQHTRAYAIEHGTAKQVDVTKNVDVAQPVDVAKPVAADDGNDVPLLGIILGLTGAATLGAGAAAAVTRTTRSRSRVA